MSVILNDEVDSHLSKNSLSAELEVECEAMVRFAFSKGMNVPVSLMKKLQRYKETPTIEAITSAHNTLASLISPAQPQTIRLVFDEQNKHSPFLFLGSVPLIRRMMMVAVISLLVLMGLSLSDLVNSDTMSKGMFDLAGKELLFVQLVLLSSAAVGASFSGLFRANSFVSRGDFDPKLESEYWVLFVVGLISGITLTQLIPINVDGMVSASGDILATADKSTNHAALKVTIALLGGFSSNLMYKLLDRIVSSIQSLISPSPAASHAVNQQQVQNQYRKEKLEYVSSLSQSLIALQDKVAKSDDLTKSDFQQLLANYHNQLISDEHDEKL